MNKKDFIKYAIRYLFILVVTTLFICNVSADSGAPATFNLTSSDLHSIDVSYYLSNSTIQIRYKENTDGKVVYCIQSHNASGSDLYTRTEKMDDKYVYILKNGYPNKSIFGSADKDYLTTGIAIWYVINPNDTAVSNFDIENKTYRGAASDIAAKVSELVKGSMAYQQVNPTLTLKNTSTTLTLSEDKRYYVSPLMGVTTAGEIKGNNYSVSLSDAPSGTIVTDSNGAAKSSFNISESFYVKVPTESINTTSIGFSVNVSAAGTIYSVYKYVSSNTSYQDVAALYSESKPLNASVRLTMGLSTEVQISKVDAVTGKELPGAHLVVKDESDNVIEQWISTDEVHIIRGLNPGRYTLTETIAASGYILSTETISFEISSDGTVNDRVVMKNDPINMFVFKVGNDGKTKLPGAKLQIKDKNGQLEKDLDGKDLIWISTDKNEKFHLPAGEYTLEEIEAPKGYELSDKVIEFTITPDGKVLIDKNEVAENIIYYKNMPEPEQVPTGNIIIYTAIVGILTGGIVTFMILKSKGRLFKS